jgi:hypothetical protein
VTSDEADRYVRRELGEWLCKWLSDEHEGAEPRFSPTGDPDELAAINDAWGRLRRYLLG